MTRIEVLTNKLDKKYKEIQSLRDDTPAEVSAKIEAFSQVAFIIGELRSIAKLEYGYKYAERKKAFAEALVNSTGTVAEKEAWAEIAVHKLRREEAEAEADLTKWEAQYDATKEIINALKKRLEVLVLDYKG